MTLWMALHGGNQSAIVQGQAKIRWRVFADNARPHVGEIGLDRFGSIQESLHLLEKCMEEFLKAKIILIFPKILCRCWIGGP